MLKHIKKSVLTKTLLSLPEAMFKCVSTLFIPWVMYVYTNSQNEIRDKVPQESQLKNRESHYNKVQVQGRRRWEPANVKRKFNDQINKKMKEKRQPLTDELVQTSTSL